MMALHRLACAVLVTLGTSLAGAIPAPAPVLVEANWAEPARHAGSCPVTIRFHSRLSGTWEAATYQWVRSDGVRTPPATITFNSSSLPTAVTEMVTMEWQIAQPGQHWAAVEVLKDAYAHPTPSTAGKALVRVDCTSTSDPCAFDNDTGPMPAQLLACSESRYERAMTQLNDLLKNVRAQLADDASLEADERERLSLRRTLLEDAQKSWQAYTAATCAAAYQEIFPGNFARIHRSECRERLLRERISELQRTYFAPNE